MKRFVVTFVATLCLTSVAFAAPRSLMGVSQRPGRRGTEVVVHAEQASLKSILSALEPMTGKKIVAQTNTRRFVDFDGVFASATDALERLARECHLALSAKGRELILRDVHEATVTLDVKDADVHDILASLKKQCGIRNLIIDSNVQGSGTFLFTNLPCETALKTVFSTLGLSAEFESGSLVHVAERK